MTELGDKEMIQTNTQKKEDKMNKLETSKMVLSTITYI